MSIKVSPFMGGLGIDATNKFELLSNATLTVGDGSTTGNIVVGTITAGQFNGLSSNSIGESDTAVSVIDPAISVVSDGADVLVIDRSQGVESVFTGNVSISGGSRLTISDIADVNNDGIRLDDNTTGRFNNITQDTSGNFKIQHYTGSAWQNNFTLSTAGKLGLGTTSPSTTLDVAGNVSLGTNSSNTITLTGSIDLGTL